jgi:hypothetical protein
MNSAASQGPDADLYPELLRQGGLAQAMASLAHEDGIDLGNISTQSGPGRYVTAEVASGRGVIRVLLGAESRWFSITIADKNHVWAFGGSVELADVVRVADAWRGGVDVEGLRSRFPFIELGSLALEYERGDAIDAQWLQLLADQDLVAIRPLLAAARSHHRLASLFPYVSHLTMLRMMRDHEDRTAGEISIMQKVGELQIEDTRTGFSATASTVDQAVTIAASLI